jgi:predicted DNA-binding transcriptional regulator AlpA
MNFMISFQLGSMSNMGSGILRMKELMEAIGFSTPE